MIDKMGEYSRFWGKGNKQNRQKSFPLWSLYFIERANRHLIQDYHFRGRNYDLEGLNNLSKLPSQ